MSISDIPIEAPPAPSLTIHRQDLMSFTPPEEVAQLCFTSPPYKEKEGYSYNLMWKLGNVLGKILTNGGTAVVNFGQLKEDFGRAAELQNAIYLGAEGRLTKWQTIIWVKSIVIDGKQRGHYQPLHRQSPLLNYCWEYLFTFRKGPVEQWSPIDKLAIGVPYADKSNLVRDTRGMAGDVHCAGDVWFIPYKTTGNKHKKQHKYEFPEELVERCIKLYKPTKAVFEPFLGSGTTAVVAKRHGLDCIATEIDSATADGAMDRWLFDRG